MLSAHICCKGNIFLNPSWQWLSSDTEGLIYSQDFVLGSRTRKCTNWIINQPLNMDISIFI